MRPDFQRVKNQAIVVKRDRDELVAAVRQLSTKVHNSLRKSTIPRLSPLRRHSVIHLANSWSSS